MSIVSSSAVYHPSVYRGDHNGQQSFSNSYPQNRGVSSHPIEPMSIDIPHSQELAYRLVPGAPMPHAQTYSGYPGENRPKRRPINGIPSVLLPPQPSTAPRSAPPTVRRPSPAKETPALNLVQYGEVSGPTGASFFYRTPIPAHKQRINQACEKCRDRKTKCTGEKPSCNRCVSRGLPCIYATNSRVRGPNRNRDSIAPGNASSSPSPSTSSISLEKMSRANSPKRQSLPEVIDLIEDDAPSASHTNVFPIQSVSASQSMQSFESFDGSMPSFQSLPTMQHSSMQAMMEGQNFPDYYPSYSMPSVPAMPETTSSSGMQPDFEIDLSGFDQNVNWEEIANQVFESTISTSSSSMSSHSDESPMSMPVQLDADPVPGLSDADSAELFGMSPRPVDMTAFSPLQYSSIFAGLEFGFDDKTTFA